MKTKELLTIEFRYHDEPREYFSGHASKTITIGVFDTLDQAVEEGNNAIEILSKTFEVRKDDKFTEKGLFDRPTRLVTNTCYSTKGIEYFAKITSLKFDDLTETISETFKAFERYKQYENER